MDDADEALAPSSASTFHVDGDGDGYGLDDEIVLACEQPPGTAIEG